MIFPLADVYREHKSIASFLTELVDALKKEDAIRASDNLDRSNLQKGWAWLRRYFKMEPGFFGFQCESERYHPGCSGGIPHPSIRFSVHKGMINELPRLSDHSLFIPVKAK